jgi:hypothetical protein
MARRESTAVPAVFLAVTTLVMVTAVHSLWPRHPNVPDWKGPTRLPVTRTSPTEPFAGNTLLLHNWTENRVQNKVGHLIAALESDPTMPSGAMALWSIPRTINGYSALPHAGLKKAMCFNVWGHSCSKAVESLFEVPEGLSLRRDELLNIEEIRVKKSRFTLAPVDWPGEWRLAETTGDAFIYRRATPQRRPPGTVAWIDPGLEVRTEGAAQVMSETLLVANATDQSRQMIFSRPSYPGYGFALDGRPLPVDIVDKIFLAVSIPAHAQGRLVLGYRPPLLVATGPLALAGLLLAAFLARRYHRG